MLGEPIGEIKGKISYQKVLDVEGPKMETTVSAGGYFKGIEITAALTYVASPSSEGVLHGVGKGVMHTADGEIVTYMGQGIGKFDSSGLLNWRGALFFKTNSQAKLQFLNNMVGVFEAHIDSQGNFTEKTWEWK